ncbi:hypothetical protein R1flu_002688 [Riccia fluitans]|uniref:Reverse transcriptase Ty1/copia-type domain-containing protein n=1 Tax=Riccia fluitans TaxID=41844 RepID=A0ABD1Y6T5_9MARC
MDVVTSFLYGVLDEEIFMRQLPSFARKGQESLVCRLLKSLYGLKQSPRQWNKRFDEFMKSQGFTRSVEDPCVYLKRVNNEVFGLVILVLYVDDMLIAAKDKSEVEKVKTQLSTEFSMKDLGPAKHILGMEIHRDVKGGRLWLTQGNYARKVLERFNMLDAKPVGTPLANHFKHQLSAKFCPLDAMEKGLMSKISYESAVGSLMYLMVCTRPDIAYALGKVSKYNVNPGKVHWEVVKWILRYIKGTMGYGLLFDAHSHQAKTLVGFVELRLCTRFGHKSALYLAANQVMSSKIKHIDVKYHFIKQVVSKGKVKVQKVAGTVNPADGFTKYIPLESFSSHRAKLQILPMDEEEN